MSAIASIAGTVLRHDQGAFALLTELYNCQWPDTLGGAHRQDEFGIDSGYGSNIVCEWTRRRPGTRALKGEGGWGVPRWAPPAMSTVDYRGRHMKGAAKLRAVGTWPVKANFYTYLGVAVRAEGAGMVHFGTFRDDVYFKQITAEYLAEERSRALVPQGGCRIENDPAREGSGPGKTKAQSARLKRSTSALLESSQANISASFRTAAKAADVEVSSSNFVGRRDVMRLKPNIGFALRAVVAWGVAVPAAIIIDPVRDRRRHAAREGAV